MSARAPCVALAAAWVVAARASSADPGCVWAAWSASPVAVEPAARTAAERAAAARCGTEEAGLRATARALVEQRRRGVAWLQADDLAALQRSVGEPHPWARAWMVSGQDFEHDGALAALDAWLGQVSTRASLRRCGVASGDAPDGSHVLVVVEVEALADLAPLPTQARPGEWLSLEARMRVPARGGEVVVLGPSGAPRTLPASFEGGVVRARFAPERPGEFTVQVMADVEGGPRPVLEATVFAGIAPHTPDATRPAPGESSDGGAPDDADGLAPLIAAARGTAGLPPLVRDARLDAVAREHARRMAAAGQLAHDAGDGDPVERLRAAGIDTAYAGENVARAASVALAHRATWASPSHRANLLRRQFRRVGIGVVRGDHGDVWVTETFAGPR